MKAFSTLTTSTSYHSPLNINVFSPCTFLLLFHFFYAVAIFWHPLLYCCQFDETLPISHIVNGCTVKIVAKFKWLIDFLLSRESDLRWVLLTFPAKKTHWYIWVKNYGRYVLWFLDFFVFIADLLIEDVDWRNVDWRKCWLKNHFNTNSHYREQS